MIFKRLPLLLALILLPLLWQCGQNPMIAGGTSEVGNPNSASHQASENDSTSGKIIGIKINFQNQPIRFIFKDQQPITDTLNP